MPKTNPKLHLGCGQYYLEGYVNIDYPLDEHTVQTVSVADELADITTLSYKSSSISEVRCHHFFEHFERTQALGLLAGWTTWLEIDGQIHIEVPDFDATAKSVLCQETSEREKFVGLRHIFGSNEAPWAIHYEGWSPERLKTVAEMYGFEVISLTPNSYKGTFNTTIIAKKVQNYTEDIIIKNTEKYLKNFTLDVDDSDFETTLLKLWMDKFKKQFDLTKSK